MAAPDWCCDSRGGPASMPDHSTRAAWTRSLTGTVALAALTLVLSGCSGSDGAQQVAPKPSPLPTAPAEALWNPCSALPLARVEKLLGESMTREAGTPSEPACRFTPSATGGPAVDVNYQLYPGTLEQLFGSFGIVTDGTDEQTDVQEVEAPGSDGARLVSFVQQDTLAVTGFVKNGDLVQLVNVLDPTPYDRDQISTAVTAMLGDLAAKADQSGLAD